MATRKSRRLAWKAAKMCLFVLLIPFLGSCQFVQLPAPNQPTVVAANH